MKPYAITSLIFSFVYVGISFAENNAQQTDIPDEDTVLSATESKMVESERLIRLSSEIAAAPVEDIHSLMKQGMNNVQIKNLYKIYVELYNRFSISLSTLPSLMLEVQWDYDADYSNPVPTAQAVSLYSFAYPSVDDIRDVISNIRSTDMDTFSDTEIFMGHFEKSQLVRIMVPKGIFVPPELTTAMLATRGYAHFTFREAIEFAKIYDLVDYNNNKNNFEEGLQFCSDKANICRDSWTEWFQSTDCGEEHRQCIAHEENKFAGGLNFQIRPGTDYHTAFADDGALYKAFNIVPDEESE